MGRYRARDLLLAPSLLSAARLPLAVAFVFVVDTPALALAVLCAAAVSDVLDGWVARRYSQVTATGAVIDPITDKIFVLTVVATLLWTGRLSLIEVLLLGTRDIGELPLVLWLSGSRRLRAARKEQPQANVLGKLATVAQFVAVLLVLLAHEQRTLSIYVASLMGVLAAAGYWRRALLRRRLGPGSEA